MKKYKAVIIGGGAAGMMAGVMLSRAGVSACIIEKNEKLGKKLFITGKGRCNVTNFCPTDEIFGKIITNKKFMYSSVNAFSNYDVYGLFEELGVPLKVERGDRVFPVSDKSSDVISALKKELIKNGCDIMLDTKVLSVSPGKVETTRGDVFGEYIIIATGGASYQSTGSTGDGYEFAKKLGHKLVKPVPGLIPLVTKEEYIKELMGLSLKNVSVSFVKKGNVIYEDFGEMLFTHFGVSGPVILSASSVVRPHIAGDELKLFIDLKPALDEKELDKRILRDFSENINKNFENSLAKLLPNKIIDVVVRLSKIDPYKKVNLITKEQREGLVKLIKSFPATIVATRPLEEAIITCGGVDVGMINPKTMESKVCSNVFFAGEVMDVDALTGGFNLQIAWSSACACAREIIKRTEE